MGKFDLEVDKGYEYMGVFYSQKGWDTFCAEDVDEIVADRIYSSIDPIIVNGIDDAKKCAVYDCVIGSQKFEHIKAYDSLLNTYLTVISSDFAKNIKLAVGLVEPDVMYTLLRVNHPIDHAQKGDSFQVISNILKMAKVQLGLASFYQEWSEIIQSGDLAFKEFCEVAERWELVCGEESLLNCMANIYRPKNTVLAVDFSDSRTRIIALMDQINFELQSQGFSYQIEDIEPEFGEMVRDARKLAELQDLETDPNNDDAWTNFIAKHKGEGWLDFIGGEDLSGENQKKSDEDDFNSGLEDEDFS